MIRQILVTSAFCIALTFLFSCTKTSAQQFSGREGTPHQHDTSPAKQEDNPIRQFLAAEPGVLIGRRYKGQDLEALREELKNKDWSQFTPPPITEPNCFVEIQQVQRLPGRCTRLGGRIPACQAQNTVNIDYVSCGGGNS